MKDSLPGNRDRSPITHRLKTENPWFQDVWDRKKPFETRWDDRNFRVGDSVELFEFDPTHPEILAGTREIHGSITYVMEGEPGLAFPLLQGGVIFAFTETHRIDPVHR